MEDPPQNELKELDWSDFVDTRGQNLRPGAPTEITSKPFEEADNAAKMLQLSGDEMDQLYGRNMTPSLVAGRLNRIASTKPTRGVKPSKRAEFLANFEHLIHPSEIVHEEPTVKIRPGTAFSPSNPRSPASPSTNKRPATAPVHTTRPGTTGTGSRPGTSSSWETRRSVPTILGLGAQSKTLGRRTTSPALAVNACSVNLKTGERKDKSDPRCRSPRRIGISGGLGDMPPGVPSPRSRVGLSGGLDGLPPGVSLERMSLFREQSSMSIASLGSEMSTQSGT